ncbi:MAG: hypothetical protein NKF70_12705 [Methanobacterium sp. ERen5]|nr:MAG: hypothetical protein NKF70_12705 [Methanobacterium sp. ERen5]
MYRSIIIERGSDEQIQCHGNRSDLGFDHIVLIAHTATPLGKDKVFENQFIKFNYSSDFTIVDKSNGTSLSAVIYYGDPENKIVIGTIFFK